MPTLVKRIRWRGFIAVVCVAWFNVAVSKSVEVHRTVKKTVLVLHGDRLSILAVKATDQRLMAGLSRGPKALEVYSDYLDLSRFPAAQYGSDLVRYLHERYASRKPDLVLAVGSALDFALEHRDELFADVPIVFANVDHREVEGEKMPPHVTGLWMAWDYQRTVELSLRLQPETRELVVVSGTGSQEQRWNNEARKVLEHCETRVRARWLDNLPLETVLDEVAHLPLDSVVLYISMLRDGAGNPVSLFEVARQLAQASKVPVYGLSGPQFEQGIIGGALLDFSEIGNKAAAMVFRVLDDGTPHFTKREEAQDRFRLVEVSPGGVLLINAKDHIVLVNARAERRFIAKGRADLPKLDDLFQAIAADGRRAGENIRGIRGMVRKSDEVRSPVNLNEVIGSVLRFVQSNAIGRHCALVTERDPKFPLVTANQAGRIDAGQRTEGRET